MKPAQVDLQDAFAPKAMLVRLVIVVALVLTLATLFAKPIASALLPLYREVLERITDDYHILFLGLSTEGADSVIRVDVTLARTIVVGDHLVFPNPKGVANASTLIGYILQPFTVGLIAILVWPARSWRINLLRLPFLVLLALIETMLDIPLLLTGELWGLFIDNLAPGNWSPLTAWADFLENGGRLALGIAIALASIAAANHVALKSRLASRPISSVLRG